MYYLYCACVVILIAVLCH